MNKRQKRLVHRVLVSLQIECEVGASSLMDIVRNLTVEDVINNPSKIHGMKFLTIKKRTEPFSKEEVIEAYERRRQKSIFPVEAKEVLNVTSKIP